MLARLKRQCSQEDPPYIILQDMSSHSPMSPHEPGPSCSHTKPKVSSVSHWLKIESNYELLVAVPVSYWSIVLQGKRDLIFVMAKTPGGGMAHYQIWSWCWLHIILYQSKRNLIFVMAKTPGDGMAHYHIWSWCVQYTLCCIVLYCICSIIVT